MGFYTSYQFKKNNSYITDISVHSKNHIHNYFRDECEPLEEMEGYCKLEQMK